MIVSSSRPKPLSHPTMHTLVIVITWLFLELFFPYGNE